MSISTIGNWLGSRWGGFPPWGTVDGQTDGQTDRAQQKRSKPLKIQIMLDIWGFVRRSLLFDDELTTVYAIMGIYGSLSALYRHTFTGSERTGIAERAAH